MITDSHGKKQLLLRISEDLHSKIKSAADEMNISMSAWITLAVQHSLDMEPAGILKEVQAVREHVLNRTKGTKTNWWE